MPRVYTPCPYPAPTPEMLRLDDVVTFFSIQEDVEKRRPAVHTGKVKVTRENEVVVVERFAKPKRADAKNRHTRTWLLRYVRLRTLTRDGVLIARLPHLPGEPVPKAPEQKPRPRRTLPA